MGHHIRDLNNNQHHNKHLQNAWNKYGSSAFNFELLEECDESLLDERENFYILKFDTYNNGYNFDLGGKGIRGYKHTDEEIDKMRRVSNTPIVLQFDKEYNLINRWIGGVSHISKELKYTKEVLNTRCRHTQPSQLKPLNMLYKDCYWVYEEEYLSDNFSWDKYLKNIPCINIGELFTNLKLKNPVIQSDKNGNYITIWNSVSELINEGYNVDIIRNICSPKCKTINIYNGSHWCYLTSDNHELNKHIA